MTTICEAAFVGDTNLTSIDLTDSLTHIINSAFRGCTGLTEVTIPCGIGPMAFADCTGLERVELRGSMMWAAFAGCTSLKEVIIHDGLDEIDFDTFLGCTSLTEITIPDSVMVIGTDAFRGCTALETVNLGSGLFRIEDSVFEDCTALTELYLPASLLEIIPTAFDGCVNLERLIVDEDSLYFSFADRILYNKDRTEIIMFLPGELGHMTIPEGVARIGDSLFRNRTDLTGITLPTTLREIGDYAFQGCTTLTEITLADGVASIGDYAFYGCTGLTEFLLPDSVSALGAGAFQNCTALEDIRLGSGLTEIGYSAFENCALLTGISIPERVTSIGGNAFYGCTALAEIQVDPDSAAYYAENGVLYTKDLSTLLLCPAGKQGTVDIPSGVATITNSAFAECTGITEVTIPDTVTEIRSGAFRECSGLTEIVIPNSVTRLADRGFVDCSGLTKVTLPNTLNAIPDCLFTGCTSLEEITLPDTVNTINLGAFSGCSSLRQITFSDNLTSIYSSAFEDCTSLETVFLPKDVSIISSSAFRGCTGLKEFRIDPDNPHFKVLDGLLYSGDMSRLLTCPAGRQGAVVIPEGVTEVAEGAFYRCAEITAVHIPVSISDLFALRSYYGNAFKDCSSLETITVAQNHPCFSVEGRALLADGGSRLCALPGAYTGEYTIPCSITAVEFGAFAACHDLTGILVEEGHSAFSSVDGVLFNANGINLIRYPAAKGSSYTVPDGVKFINEEAFSNCDALTEIHLSSSIIEVGYDAFLNCTSLTDIYYAGTQEQWDAVIAALGDKVVENLTFHFWNCSAGPEHTWDEGVVTVAPTCTTDGQRKFTCTVCGAEKTETELSQGHNYQASYVDPTCTEPGFTTYTCACGDTYTSDETAALGHDFGEWIVIKEATEDAEGEEKRECTRCDETETRSIPKLDHVHKHTAEVTAPTCTEPGFTTYTCECGDSYTADETAALGHEFVDGTCTRCEAADPDYVEPVVNPFTDVPGGQWYTDPVLWAVEQGITSGTSANAFSPDKTCTRGQVVTFLWRAKGEPEPTLTENPFSDVKASDYFYKAVLWAVENGITSGTSKTTFAPNNPCTRAQVVTFLWRTMDKPAPEQSGIPFTDVPAGQWYTDPILWAVENGITSGTSKTTFAPNNPCTRAQVVTFLYRAFKEN